jgi:hypothetical protein
MTRQCAHPTSLSRRFTRLCRSKASASRRRVQLLGLQVHHSCSLFRCRTRRTWEAPVLVCRGRNIRRRHGSRSCRIRGGKPARKPRQLISRPASGLKYASSTAQKFLEGRYIAPRGTPIMDCPMGTMMSLHSGKEGCWVIASGHDRSVHLIFVKRMAFAPRMTSARVDCRT